MNSDETYNVYRTSKVRHDVASIAQTLPDSRLKDEIILLHDDVIHLIEIGFCQIFERWVLTKS